MKWYEVVEDCGDGSSAVRRFRSEEEAQMYVENNPHCDVDGFYEMDTDSPYFFTELDE